MLRFLLTRTLLLGASLLFFYCDPNPPVVHVPADCGFDVPKVTFSDPAACTPRLTRFTRLDQSIGAQGKLPALPFDCTAAGVTEIAELPGVDDDGFTLHVYNSTANDLFVRVYGMEDCGDVTPVTACKPISGIAAKVKVGGLTKRYSRFFVRFTLDKAPASPPLTSTDFIALAAYDDAEPAPAGSIDYQEKGDKQNGYPTQRPDMTGKLFFDCSGSSFQRLVLSSCEQDATLLREWAKLTGLPIAEQYYGPKGNVVVLTVPPGMDINTGGDGARTMPGKINTGSGGSVEPDYLINLFTPEEPSITDGMLTMFMDDREVRTTEVDKDYPGLILPPFKPLARFDSRLEKVLVTFIDSGVDTDEPNRAIWEPTRYEEGVETEFVRRNGLGFDFVAKRLDPRRPHAPRYLRSRRLPQYLPARKPPAHRTL